LHACYCLIYKRDIDRIREWKQHWKQKGLKLDDFSNLPKDFSLLNQLTYGYPSFTAVPSGPGPHLNQVLTSEDHIEPVIISPITEVNKAEKSYHFSAVEKEGTIGVFSDAEQDRTSDNFFTINLPKTDLQDARVFLTYELYGLASHTSVSRSVNHQLSIGGEIIIPSGAWSVQKEEITPSLLKEGANTVMFTSPASGIKYKVRNLKIEIEKNKKAAKGYQISSVLSGDHLYVKGTSRSNSIKIDNKDISWNHGEFETVVKLSAQQKESGRFSLTYEGNTEYIKIPEDKKSFKVIGNSIYDYKTITITKDQEVDVNYEDLNFKSEKDAAESASIEIIKLREKDIPAVSGGLKNMTPVNAGYRFAVKSGKLNKSVKITIPYDEKKLGLFSPKTSRLLSLIIPENNGKLLEELKLIRTARRLLLKVTEMAIISMESSRFRNRHS
jgi:hypothetical protein